MKVYGTEICIDCRNYLAVQKRRGFQAEFVDITSSTEALKEFLALRDHEAIFANVRANGSIGVPFFVADDGRKTFELNQAMLWLGLPPVEDCELPEKREH